MKLSNNALTFLLAQYRAIFKQAYLKGLAPAVLLTAALAAGQAQAISALSDVANLPASGEIVIDSDGDYSHVAITSGTNPSWNGELIIHSGAASATDSGNRFTSTKGATTLSGTGTLTIDLTTYKANDGLIIGGNSGNAVNVNLGAINVNNGLLKITDKIAKSGTTTVAANTINIGTGSASSDTAIVSLIGETDKGVIFGRAADTAAGAIGSQITVGAHGTLNVSGTGASGTQIFGDTLTIREDGLMTTTGNNNVVKSANFSVEEGGFHVISGTGTSEKFTGQEATIAGHFLVDSGAGWVIENTTDKTADNQDYVPKVTIESGADFQLGGTLTVSGATLTVADGANLVATKAAGTSDSSGTIVVTKDSAGSGGTLTISSSELKQFLTGKSGDEEIKYKAILKGTGQVGEISETETPAQKGSVYLSGGILALLDTNQVDLAKDLSFSGGASNGVAGSIAINSTGGGTVKGHDLLVSEKIANLDGGKLTVEADTLTIGSGSSTGKENKLSAFNVSNAVAHDVVNLVSNDPNGTTFTIDTNLDLKRDYYDKDADDNNLATVKAPGRITGDNLVISGDAAAAPVTVTGAWVNDGQSLSLQSGTLTIAAVSGDKVENGGQDQYSDTQWSYYKKGNPAELKWEGKFAFDATDDAEKAKVEVTGDSGANAVLDLQDADVTWGSGSITLKGAMDGDDPVQVSPTDYFARAGQGILKLDGDQVVDFLGLSGVADAEDDTHLKIEDGGLLLVEGSINRDLDVATAFTSTDAAKSVWLSGGHMFVTGDLSLVDGVDDNGKPDSETATGLTFDGVLGADNITFTNKSKNIKADDLSTDVATVSGGTLAVASSFSSANHEVEFLSGAGLLLATHGFLADWAPDTASESGVVNVDLLTFSGKDDDGNYSQLDVQTGAWTIGAADALGDVDILSGAALNVGPGSEEYVRTGVGASLTLDNLTVTNGESSNSGSVTVDVGGALTVNTLQMDAGAKLKVESDATVTITGAYAHNLVDGKLADDAPQGIKSIGADKLASQAGISLSGAVITLNSGKLVFGDTASRALIQFDSTAAEGKQVTINKAIQADYTLTGTSELRLDFTKKEGEQTLTGVNGGKALTAAQAKALKEGLFGASYTDAKFSVGSYINVGELALGMEYNSGSMTADWTKIEDFVQIESAVTNPIYMQLLVQNADQGQHGLAGQFGAVEANSTVPATVAGSLGLHKAYGEGSEKFFASTVQNGTRVAAGLRIDKESAVALYGAGTIGTLTGQGTNTNTTIYFSAADPEFGVAGTTVVKPINANDKAIANVGAMVVDNDVVVEGAAEVGSLKVTRSLSAENLTLGNDDKDNSTVFGRVDVAETLSVGQGSTLFVADGVVKTTNLVLDGATLTVGWDAQGADNPKTDLVENQSYTGSLYASTIELKDGGIVVDPALDQNTAIVGFNQFKGGNRTKTSFDLGATGGNLFVGQNSVIGAGFATMADLEEFIAPQQVNGALSGQYKAIFALDGLLTVSSGKGLTMTAQSVQDFEDYITSGSGSYWNAHGFNPQYGTIANTVYFGADSALKLSAEAVQEAEGANAAQAVITLDSNLGSGHRILARPK